jgi:hypothetical protein
MPPASIGHPHPSRTIDDYQYIAAIRRYFSLILGQSQKRESAKTRKTTTCRASFFCETSPLFLSRFRASVFSRSFVRFSILISREQCSVSKSQIFSLPNLLSSIVAHPSLPRWLVAAGMRRMPGLLFRIRHESVYRSRSVSFPCRMIGVFPLINSCSACLRVDFHFFFTHIVPNNDPSTPAKGG